MWTEKWSKAETHINSKAVANSLVRGLKVKDKECREEAYGWIYGSRS